MTSLPSPSVGLPMLDQPSANFSDRPPFIPCGMLSIQPDVCLFVRWLRSGGAERVMLNLANGLARQGLTVDLLLLKREGPYLEELDSRIRIIDLAMDSASEGWGIFKAPTSFQATGSLLKLVGYLRRVRPLTLISATHYLNEISVIAKAIAQVKTRVILTEHTFLTQESWLTEQTSSKLIPLAVRALYRFADEVVAVSQGVADDLETLQARPSQRTRVIYNSVVVPEMFEQAQQPVDHPWFQTNSIPIVLGGGRFVKQKDLPTLVRAFAHVVAQRPARLVLMGDGRERPHLEALVAKLGLEEWVWFSGFQTNPYPLLKRASVFALSSAWEGLPTILIEALALGTAVVATDCPSGPREILQGGQYGRLVPVGDAAALGAAIAATLDQPYAPPPKDWLAQFTPEVVIHRYISVLGLGPSHPMAPEKADVSLEVCSEEKTDGSLEVDPDAPKLGHGSIPEG